MLLGGSRTGCWVKEVQISSSRMAVPPFEKLSLRIRSLSHIYGGSSSYKSVPHCYDLLFFGIEEN